MASGSPQRVFVVEDEPAIIELITEMLEDLSFKVAATASRLDDAVALAREIDVDLAILDVRLQGQQSEPVARILQVPGYSIHLRDRLSHLRNRPGVPGCPSLAEALSDGRPCSRDQVGPEAWPMIGPYRNCWIPRRLGIVPLSYGR